MSEFFLYFFTDGMPFTMIIAINVLITIPLLPRFKNDKDKQIQIYRLGLPMLTFLYVVYFGVKAFTK